MKLLTKEEEAAHYRATLQGGSIGGAVGLAVGAVGVWAASQRYHFFRNLTLPLKAFLVTSSGTFAGIIAADHASRSFQTSRNPLDLEYQEMELQKVQADRAKMSWTERAMDFGKKERYKIVGGSWLASMVIAFQMVNRDKLLTGAQKLVQARVYAQFLTLGVLVATAAFEISDARNDEGQWETVKYIDPKDPEHKRVLERQQEVTRSEGDTMWKDMVAAEEERLKEQDQERRKIHEEKGKKNTPKKSDGNGGGDKKKTVGKDSKKDNHKEDEESDSKSDKKGKK